MSLAHSPHRRCGPASSLAAALLLALGAAGAAGCTTTVRHPAAALPPIAHTPADELYELSPARVHARRLAPLALRLLAPHWSSVREGDRKALQATLVETMSEDRVVPFLHAALAKDVAAHPDLAEKTLQWLRGPLGYEVKFAEATAWTGEKSPDDAFYADVAEVKDNRAPEVRMDRLRKLAEATDALDRTLDLTEAVGTVVARLVNVGRPDATPLSMKALHDAVTRERGVPDVVTAYKPVVTAALMVRCRDLDLQELDQYIAFAETDAGRWYHRALSDALVEAVRQASTDVEGVFDVNAHSDAAETEETSTGSLDLDSLAVTLPSGRSIRLLALAQTGPQDQPAIVLRYETSLPLGNVAAITGEAHEVWDRVRGQVESEGAHAAVLQATGSVNGWVFPFASSRKFAWKRDDSGQWISLQGSSPHFGSIEREMLWSVPP
jgi:hypothetical protein